MIIIGKMYGNQERNGSWHLVRHYSGSHLDSLRKTNSMEQSHFWESDRLSDCLEIPHHLWNPKVHYHVHKSTPIDRILSQFNSVHNIKSSFLNINFSVILLSVGACGNVVDLDTMLQAGRSLVWVPMMWIFFNWPNPSSRTMVLGSTQPLTEMSTRNHPGIKAQPAHKADVIAICEPIV
jgi:hypothetical protein